MANTYASDGEKYRTGLLQRFPLTDESEIVYVPSAKRAFILPRRDIQRLAVCSEFLSLAEHANNIVRRFSPSSDPEEVRTWLAESADSGVLISYSNLLETCASTVREIESGRRLDWLAVPTRSRPDGLLRTVRSFGANIQACGHRLRLIVSDQTPVGASLPDCRAELRAVAREMGFEIFYAGIEEKTAFADALCSAGSIPLEVARFALLGWADASANIGANRNATLLQTLGSMMITADDDTLCETACAPGTRCEVRFRGETDPTEVWFFGDRADVRASVKRSEIDFVEAHHQMLGRRVGEILKDVVETRGADLKSMCVHILECLCSGSGQVLSTYGGLAGDAGVHSAFSFLIHPSRTTRARLTASPEAYTQNVRSREVVRQALCATIAHGPRAAGLATCLGLDNREMLPPFFPPYRSEDGIFALTLARCRDRSCVGHVPFTVLHDRPERRTYADVTTVRMSDLALNALSACPAPIGEVSATERLVRFGAFLKAVGTLADDQFHEWARAAVFARAAGIGRVAEAALKRDCCYPDYWARDVSEIVERMSRAVLDPNYIVPDEVKGCGGLPAAKEILRQFGELLCWWPAIVERTKSLADAGIHIGRRLG